MPNVAFKEWAVVCRALAGGRQTILLRKGGIAEEGGVFRPDHSHFLLYPTFFHEQQADGIRPEFTSLLDAAVLERPPQGQVRFHLSARVRGLTFASQLDDLLALSGMHIWSEATVRQRFAYRNPGLYLLLLEVSRLHTPIEIAEDPSFAGCKTWVQLQEMIEAAESSVLHEADWLRAAESVRAVFPKLQSINGE